MGFVGEGSLIFKVSELGIFHLGFLIYYPIDLCFWKIVCRDYFFDSICCDHHAAKFSTGSLLLLNDQVVFFNVNFALGARLEELDIWIDQRIVFIRVVYY